MSSRGKRAAPADSAAAPAGKAGKGSKAAGAGAAAAAAAAADKDGGDKHDSSMHDDAANSTAAASSSAAAASSSAAASAASSAPSKRGPQKSIRASDQKRKKLIPRCTSPSHFLLEQSGDGSGAHAASASLASPLPSALSCDPNAPASTKLSESSARIDGFLHSIGTMYYRNQSSLLKPDAGASGSAAAAGPADVWVSSDYDKLEYPTLDLLLSPLRKSNVLDDWCPREIALFEAGICAVGKDFHAISNLISSKSCKECVDFYYLWKKSSHYALWKQVGKPSKKPHPNKEEQWKQIREQMGVGIGAGAAAAAAAKDEQKSNGTVKKEA